MRQKANRQVASGQLAALIHESRMLNPLLKEQWLRLLPHLRPADRSRLEAILRSEPAFEDRSAHPGVES